MAEQLLHCSVITPEAQVYDGDVDSVVIPAHDGEIGVLFNRAPLLCKLGAGRLRLQHAGREESWFIDGGFAQVLDNKVLVLTQQACTPDQIDRAEAEAMLELARQMHPTDDVAARKKARLEASARARLRIASS
jgi:F-type H+-transporting ATPase subunit epsilon